MSSTEPVMLDMDPQGGTLPFDVLAAQRVARFFAQDYSDYADDQDVILAFARRTRGPILELGCGTGRLLVPLAQSGYHVTGVDFSSHMLAGAASHCAEAGIADRVTLLEGDFGSLPLGGPYGLAFIAMNTFMHLLSQTDQLAALRHWRQSLRPNGLLLIDLFNPDIDELAELNGQIQLDKTWASDGNAIVMKQTIRTVDPARQLLHVTLLYDEIAPSGSLNRTMVPFDLRYLWLNEAQLLLRLAGYQLEECYGGWDLSPYDSGSERMILIARPSPGG